MRGAFSKYCWNFKASKVADITTIFKSLRLCMIWTHERECEGKQNDLHSADCVMPVLRCDDCVELRCAVLNCAELCCSVLFSTMLSCTLLRCVFAVLYSTVLSCTMLCCVFVLLYSTLLYCAVLCCALLCCAVLRCALLYSAVRSPMRNVQCVPLSAAPSGHQWIGSARVPRPE
jgi:hypothetical protein